MSERGSEETIQDRRSRLSSIPKACEACRVRKVRCDRSVPCANCRTAGIVCQQAGAQTDSRPKPDKVARLEGLIGRLDERLSRVEAQLTPQSRHTTPERLTTGSRPTRLFEGASSFNNQSVEAAGVAQMTAFSQGTGEEENLTASLDDLKSLLQPSSTLDDFQFSQNDALRSMPPMTLVPSGLVADIVRSFKERTPLFLVSNPINDLSLVEDLFRKVYFPTEPVSIGHFTAAHGILLSLFKEFIGMKDPLTEKYDFSAHLPTCEKNFNAGIETYEILAVPSFENILSVLLAVIKAQDEANALLSTTFISVAARHCLLLGYHRAVTYQNQKPDMASNMNRLFWTVYMLDKNMSLLLGRASCIQDYDIDAPYPKYSEDINKRAWDEGFVKYLTFARLQGQIYDRVYSAAALKFAPEVRAQNIESLAEELHQWRRAMDQIDWSHVGAPELVELSKPAWDIIYYSVLTSLLRGLSTSTTNPEINSQCFKAARCALQSHLRSFPMYCESTIVSIRDYANWIMLYSSFTPFIVIFLHAIAASSLEDIQLLEDIVRTLYPIKDTSKASARLYQICTIFARVARGLVESRTSFLGTYNSQDDSLLLLNDTGQTSLFDPGSLQDYFTAEVDMLDQFTYSEAEDMSAILGSWAIGQPPSVDFLGMGMG
ncbi:Zn(II)2Cys6 transcription factor [Aspergillus lucknowensis]|uniref:Fungal-specific transcription factor domain-containing protein n=1 Tax=Aspergillus lucknowensis TaxID=176173 RepID=A0ABR4LDW8_9EURO